METQGIVLLSGGLDSVFNLYCAQQKWKGAVAALFFRYGQKAWLREWEAACFFTQELGVPLKLLNIEQLFLGSRSALISKDSIPTAEVNIESQEVSEKTAQRVWVPNRNGVFLNIGALWAETQGAPFVIPGFNAEEAATFPDNSVDYIQKLNACLKLSTATGVQVHCFSQSMDKAEILGKLVDWGVDLDKIWACYEGGKTPCGECESCQRLRRASLHFSQSLRDKPFKRASSPHFSQSFRHKRFKRASRGLLTGKKQ